MNDRTRTAMPWVVTAVLAVVLVQNRQALGWGSAGSPGALALPVFGAPAAGTGPARSVALPGGGVTDGDRCGAKDYHYFPLASGQHAAAAAALSGLRVPGPQLALGAYGMGGSGPDSPWRITVSFALAPGPEGVLSLNRPLGAEGVAVEINGPQGLVAGAHGVPVRLFGAGSAPDHRIGISRTADVEADLTLPSTVLCPGVDARNLESKLVPPTDSHQTITGPPPYVLTVSVSDPGITALRTAVHAPVAGPTLTGDNVP